MRLISIVILLTLAGCSRETEFSLITEDVIKHKQGVSIDIEPLSENKGKK